MKINEMFYSVQGEGRYIGKPAFFIRTTGCNLRCDFCDTKYAFKEGKDIPVDDIIKLTSKYDHIVITGGEPLLH